MVPELGHFALIMALCLGIAQVAMPLYGLYRRDQSLMGLARPAALGQCFFVAFAFAALAYCFYVNNFSVVFVAHHSNTQLPVFYRLAAVWGGHSGSLLLWVFILAIWTSAVSAFSRRLPLEVRSSVLAVMGIVSVAFLSFMLFTSDPFMRQFPAPMQGRDLNPLLQDPGMVSHPPMLYMGYVGFSVAFAFAIAALINGRVDAAWARWARPWTTAAWLFLTVGITVGSWWSYHDLGWGGWWFWDPVENASFMPWLVGTALIHSLAVTEKRGLFKGWTVLLAISAFSLTLLGTFLVRSGILTSVHAFAVSPTRGIYILTFFGLIVGGSTLLYAIRAPKIAAWGEFRLFSREGLLLINNVLLVTATAAILLGTLYPLILTGLHLEKISVGPPYFNSVFVPLALTLLAVMGLAMSVPWKRGRPRRVATRMWGAALTAVAAGVMLPWLTVGREGMIAVVAGIMGFWAIATALEEPIRRLRSKPGFSGLSRRVPRGTWGMTCAHIGLGVAVLGVGLSSAFSVHEAVRMAPGSRDTIGGYTFIFTGTQPVKGPNYTAQKGRLIVMHNGRRVTTLYPEKRLYSGNTPQTRAAVDPGILRDLYATLGQKLGHGAWSVRLYVKPFVRCIWIGGFIMALGGFLAATDRRYRLAMPKRADAGFFAAVTD